MSIVKWNSKYSLGSAVIDEHHQGLVALLNQLESGLEEGNLTQATLIDIVEKLYQYTDYHFSEEERLMTDHLYPELRAHQEEHGAFIKEILRVRDALKKGCGPEIGREMADYLQKWLLHHILIIDKQYAIYFAEKGIHL